MHSLVIRHPVRVVKAVGTNMLAAIAPAWYSRWTGETGRGRAQVTVEATAAYFSQCIADYRERLGLDEVGWKNLVRGRRVLEYGPGDIPGVALLLVAQGAETVTCVDQFPLVQMSDFNLAVMDELVRGLEGEERNRAENARARFLASSGASGPIAYHISENGTSGKHGEVDIIISRAVLEHVSDLDASFADMARALRVGGVAIHQVDLKSHGMHISNPLDFLVWPTWLWRLMYSRKGAPNRLRVDRYRELAARHGFEVVSFESLGQVDEAAWREVCEQLPAEVRALGRDEVGCTGFWMTLKPLKHGVC